MGKHYQAALSDRDGIDEGDEREESRGEFHVELGQQESGLVRATWPRVFNGSAFIQIVQVDDAYLRKI